MTPFDGFDSMSLQNSAESPNLSVFIPAGKLSGLAFIKAIEKSQVKKYITIWLITCWQSIPWQGYYLLGETDFSFNFDSIVYHSSFLILYKMKSEGKEESWRSASLYSSKIAWNGWEQQSFCLFQCSFPGLACAPGRPALIFLCLHPVQSVK